MPMVDEKFLLQLLQACTAGEPEPLYPSRFSKEENLDRDKLDVGLEELRRRGLLRLTDWVKDFGQGYALTEAGQQAVGSGRVPTGRAVAAAVQKSSEFSYYERGEVVRRAIFAPAPARVAWVLLGANLLYFGFGAIYAGQNDLAIGDYFQGRSNATSEVLKKLGALHIGLVFFPDHVDPSYGPRPQFERIILWGFLHIGLLHLFMNLYFLYSLGQLIESMWGSPRFLAIYFVAGIVSGCMVLLISLWQNQPTGLAAGASGSMFGIFVSMVVWFYFNREHLPEGLIQDWSRNLGTNAVLLFAINFLPGISWQGHLGGAIGGLLAALLLHVERFHPSPTVRWLAIAALPMVPLGFFLAVLWQAGYL